MIRASVILNYGLHDKGVFEVIKL